MLVVGEGKAALLIFKCNTISGEYSSGLSSTYQTTKAAESALLVRQRMMESKGHNYAVLVWDMAAAALASTVPVCHYPSYASAAHAIPISSVQSPLSYKSPRPKESVACDKIITKDLIEQCRQLGESFCQLHAARHGLKPPYSQ